VQAIELLRELNYEFDQEALNDHLGHSPPSNSILSSNEGIELMHENFEKCVLTDELQCVGLNPHLKSDWAMTVLKILSYPELISPGGKSDR
jgi:hypothetical protein